MITETSQPISCFISTKSEILSDNVAPRTRAPRTRPHTALTFTTRHASQRHCAVRLVHGQAAGAARPTASHGCPTGRVPAAARRFISADAVRVVQVDATPVAGVTEWLQVAAYAGSRGLRLAPHAGDMMRVTVSVPVCWLVAGGRVGACCQGFGAAAAAACRRG
jgi:hypothetical protein